MSEVISAIEIESRADENTPNKTWQTVCFCSDLVLNSGVCALLDNGLQVALFCLESDQKKVYAISNFDPIGKANVLYRGIVGSAGDEVVVASPLYKQHFSLRTGQCLQDEEFSVEVFPSRINDGQVQLLV